jgi:predicted ATPase/DNA-binding SARP family transcriptional activator
MRQKAPASVTFGVLGSLDARADSGPLPIGTGRQRALLALLLVHVNDVVSVDRLVDSLWDGAPPASAVHTLHGLVSRTRAVIGPGRLLTEPPGYALRLAADEFDALAFEQALTRARDLAESAEPGKAVALLDDALARWRGPAYAEFADRPWAQPEAARLSELRASAIEARADWLLATGQVHRVVTDLEGATAEHPLREGMHALRMVALARSGRPTEALRSYEHLRKLLAEELGLTPSPVLQRLNQDILRQQPELDWELGAAAEALAPTRGPVHAITGMPVVLTDLIGRHAEIAALRDLLSTRRLVTVVGPAGVGKTRIAITLCESIVESGDGAAWVDLAPVTDRDAVAATVASALRAPQLDGCSVWDSVLRHLAGRTVVLVVDNCEHMLEQVASMVSEVLSAGPAVNVVATSREPLGIDGEQTFLLRPLDVPDPTAEPTDIGRADAVALFVDRAGEVRPGFEITPATARPVADVCRRLDGLPLAIELAAARMSALGVVELGRRLDDRFTVLRSGRRGATSRHRTLEEAIQWSFDLLDDDERDLFTRLGVFPASFDLSAVEAVVETSADALATLSSLVAKSLVTLDPREDGSVRYRLLETLRDFARLRLAADETADVTHRRHAEHYASFVSEAATRILGSEEPYWSDLVVLEMPNLRSAFAWASGIGQLDLALRLFTPLHPDSPVPTAVVLEIGAWADTVSTVPGADRHPSFADVCAWGLHAGGVAGDRAAIASWLERARQPGLAQPARLLSQIAQVSIDLTEQLAGRHEALERARKEGDAFTAAFEMAYLTLIMAVTAPGPETTAFGRRALGACRRTGNPTLILTSLVCLALGLCETEPAETVLLADEAMRYQHLSRGNNPALRNTEGLKGRALIMQGDRSGLATYRRSFDEAVAAGYQVVARNSIWGVFEACVILGDDEDAAELAGGLLAACGELGVPFGPFAARDELLRARMGPARYQAAHDRAASWDWPHLVDRARAIIDGTARS